MTTPASAEPAEGHMTSDACPAWNLDENGRCMDERTSASAEPTEGERTARRLAWFTDAELSAEVIRRGAAPQVIVRALSSQRAEIVARYEAVADQLIEAARATTDLMSKSVLGSSALAIREAAPK